MQARAGRRISMHQPDPAPQLRSNPLGWIADMVRHRGIVGALGYYSGAAISLLRDLSPQRRRSRYGDTDYDFDHHVDTTWATVSFRTRLRELLSGAQYQASEPELFHEISAGPAGFARGVHLCRPRFRKGADVVDGIGLPFPADHWSRTARRTKPDRKA